MLREKARAKINLGLWVEGRLAGGYHQVSTLLLPLDLWDQISFDRSPVFEMEGPNFGPDDLMKKAHGKLEALEGRGLPIKIFIEKNIPLAAGLAGGTADGAAVLRALNQVYDLGYSLQDLADLSSDLGADFPYCIYNRPAIGRGRGDRLEFLGPFEDIPCIIINPGFSVSTKDAYSWVSSFSQPPDLEEIWPLLRDKRLKDLRGLIFNGLEEGVINKHPLIGQIKEDLYRLGADLASMSGSGPSVYGLFSSQEACDRAYGSLKEAYPIVINTKILGGGGHE